MTIKVFITCYAAYNNGTLYGEWVEVPHDSDELQKEIDRVLKGSPEPDAEEWFFSDYESDYKLADKSENPDLDELCELAEALDNHENPEALTAFMDYSGLDLDDALSSFEDAYNGEWSSERDFAENLFDELYLHEIPSNLHYYVDYDAFARDIFINDYTFVDGYVFSDHY